MKLSLLAGATIAQLASAHYFFEKLVINGQETKPYEYVRENTRREKYNPTKWKNPLDDMTPDVNDFRCNKGAFGSASRTGVAEVKAGSKLSMVLGVKATMRHPGPFFVYASKAPGPVKEYEGDGDWFLIYQAGLCRKGDIKGDAWCTWDKDRMEFVIPEDTPDGEYLIRSQHVGVHGAHDGQAEFYYGCAQIKVTGGGKGTPGPMIKFPGTYKKTDPSWNFSVWGGYKEYIFPDQPVWTGGSSGGGNSTDENSVPPSPAGPTPTPSKTPNQPEPQNPGTPPSNQPEPQNPGTPPSNQPEPQYPGAPGNQPEPQYPGAPGNQPEPQYPGAPSDNQPEPQYPGAPSDNQPAPQSPGGSAPPAVPAASPAHDGSNCKGGKKHRRGRQAFRQSLRQ